MELKRVVVGVDFSEASVAAAKWTARGFAPGAELVLVHSLEVPQPPGFLKGVLPSTDELERTAREGAERRLRELGLTLGADRIWPEIRVGWPADQIAAVTEEHRADVIVVGEHGHRRGILGVLGSTAEQLARSAPAPVLLARGLPEGAPRTLLLPVDESPLLHQALGWGRFLAEKYTARVIAYYVINSRTLGRMKIVSSATKDRELEENLIADATRWLETRLTEAGFEPGATVEARVCVGDPAAEIIAASKRYAAELIVMPSRGTGVTRGALVGSVARSILRDTTCPVLVVNQPGS